MTTTQPKQGEVFTIRGNWEQQSKNLKAKFHQLTDADLKFESGKEDDLLKRVEARLSKNREEVIEIIKAEQPVRF